MTTSPTLVSWPLNGGIASKNAPLIVQPGSSLVLDNVRQERANEWRTRAGTNVSALDAVLGGQAPLMSVTTPVDGFVAMIKQANPKTAALVYTPNAVPRWHAPPAVTQNIIVNQQTCCQQTPGLWSRQSVGPAKGQVSSVTSAVGGGYRLTAWHYHATNAGVQMVFAAADGTNLQSSLQFGASATAVRPRAVYSSVANMLILVYADTGTGHVEAARWDTTTGLQLSGHTLSTNANTTDPYIDAIWYGGNTITVAFRNQSTNGLNVVEYNPAANTSTETIVGIDASRGGLSLFPDPDASGFRFVSVTTSAPAVHVLKLNAASAIVTNDTALAVDATNTAGCAYGAGAGWMIVSKELNGAMWAVKKGAYGVSGAFDLAWGVGKYFDLASNAWREPNTDAMKFAIVCNEDGQQTYSEMALEYDTSDVVAGNIEDRWPEPQARMLPLNASATLTRSSLPQVFRTSTDTFITALGRITSNLQAGDNIGVEHVYAVDAWTVQYMNESNRYTLNNGTGTTTQTDSFLPAGTLVQTATGQLVCGHGSSALPFQPTLTGVVTGGGGLLIKLYQYGVTVEMPDENGLSWRSPMSLVASQKLSGGQNSMSVEWYLTAFENPTRRRIVKLWRTDGDGSEFKLLHVVDGSILDTLHFIFLDITADVGTGQPFSGEIQASLTPSFSQIALWNNRLWGVQRDYPSRVSFSKPLAVGFLPEFPGEYEIDIDDAHGDATGLAPMDDKIVLFKGNAIYVAGGDGPANDGSGAFPTFQLINSESGAIAGSPIVSTGAEVYFVSTGGLFWVTRAQEVAFVGAAIDAYLSMPLVNSPETVIGMIVAPGSNEVRVQTTNYRFVHDRIFNIWVRDTGAMDGSSGIVATRFLNGLQVFFTSSGDMWYEAADSNTPTDCGVTFQGRLRSPWMRPAGMEGWLRLYQMRAVAECLASGVTQAPYMSVYFDNDNNLVEYFGPRVSLGTPGPIRANAKPRKQLCTAFSPQLTLPSGNASIRFDSWAALVAIEPASQPLGGERNWIPTTPPPPAPPGTPLFWFKGDVGVTMNGSNQVSNWADQGPHGWDVQPIDTAGNFAATSRWPVLTPNVINGLPGLLFTGSGGNFNSSLLQHIYPIGTTQLPTPDSSPVTMLAIVKFTTIDAGTVVVLRLTGDDLEFGMRRNASWYNTNSPMSTAQDNNHILTVPPVTDYSNQILVLDWQYFGPKPTYDPQGATHINGVFLPIYNEAPAGAKGLGQYFGNAGFSIGYCNAVFGSGNSANAMTGYIVEVLAYAGTNGAVLSAARAYMKARAGL